MNQEELDCTKNFQSKSSEILSSVTGNVQDEVKRLTEIASKIMEILSLNNEVEEVTRSIGIESSKGSDLENTIKGFQAKKAALVKKRDAFFKVKDLYDQFLTIVLLLLIKNSKHDQVFKEIKTKNDHYLEHLKNSSAKLHIQNENLNEAVKHQEEIEFEDYQKEGFSFF